MFDHNFTGPKEAPKDNFTTEDGITVSYKRTDPYGLLYLETTEAELPEKYKGAYTTIEAAKTAINHYIEDRKKALEAIPSSSPRKPKVA